jgi:hypothetical protein
MTAYPDYNPYGHTRPEIADHDDDYAHAGDDYRAAQKVEGTE